MGRIKAKETKKCHHRQNSDVVQLSNKTHVQMSREDMEIASKYFFEIFEIFEIF
jgi:hypothetical protein